MRLIDADRLLEERMVHTYYHLPNGDVAVPIIDIEHAPTVGEWIPCSERLPEIEREGQRRGWYITTNGYGSVGMTQYEFYHDLLKTGWQSEHQIVAWMPKPEPYKRGDTND